MNRHPCGRVCGPDLLLLPFLVVLALSRAVLAAWTIRMDGAS